VILKRRRHPNLPYPRLHVTQFPFLTNPASALSALFYYPNHNHVPSTSSQCRSKGVCHSIILTGFSRALSDDGLAKCAAIDRVLTCVLLWKFGLPAKRGARLCAPSGYAADSTKYGGNSSLLVVHGGACELLTIWIGSLRGHCAALAVSGNDDPSGGGIFAAFLVRNLQRPVVNLLVRPRV
jgi:hypothetical protein